MIDQQLLERIITHPQVMMGKPVIRGTRLTVEYIWGYLLMVQPTMKFWRNTRDWPRKIYEPVGW